MSYKWMIIIILAGALFGSIIDIYRARSKVEEFKIIAIQNNCAQYSPTSGDFEWKGGPR